MSVVSFVWGCAGVVGHIHVHPGQTVRKGQKLMALNAMKMDLTIASPFDGTVQSVDIKVGRAILPPAQSGPPLFDLARSLSLHRQHGKQSVRTGTCALSFNLTLSLSPSLPTSTSP